MDWIYTKEIRWKHRQSCVGVKPTGERDERASHTELEENTHGRAKSEKHCIIVQSVIELFKNNGKTVTYLGTNLYCILPEVSHSHCSSYPHFAETVLYNFLFECEILTHMFLSTD